MTLNTNYSYVSLNLHLWTLYKSHFIQGNWKFAKICLSYVKHIFNKKVHTENFKSKRDHFPYISIFLHDKSAEDKFYILNLLEIWISWFKVLNYVHSVLEIQGFRVKSEIKKKPSLLWGIGKYTYIW